MEITPYHPKTKKSFPPTLDLDGSHTPAVRGGANVEYQGRKKRKTTNAFYLSDRQGIPLAMSEPMAGNHNDLYYIEVQFEEVTATLEQADISVDGLFLNADSDFDSENFRGSCSRNLTKTHSYYLLK